MRTARRVVLLTAVWVLLWGQLSVANVTSGMIVATIVLLLYPPGTTDEPVRRLRPAAAVRLAGYVLREIVVSNAQLSRQILSRRPNVRTGVVACPLHTGSERTMTFLANVLTLGPGTIPVHVQAEPPVIYLHVLRADDPEAIRRLVARLEALTTAVFGP